jgi:hypothetical protein
MATRSSYLVASKQCNLLPPDCPIWWHVDTTILWPPDRPIWWPQYRYDVEKLKKFVTQDKNRILCYAYIYLFQVFCFPIFGFCFHPCLLFLEVLFTFQFVYFAFFLFGEILTLFTFYF